ncbi:hypothetical protein F383_35758 [Gossypium arboreum]|uniref:Uncharacterized protein n=1 Tax=Gossypium arboreum TaxID=29729 RepID=A0A0B0N721_GOSAR|nr:hypothetical protein F383_35758 [Gossypium arboreum]
MELQIKIR